MGQKNGGEILVGMLERAGIRQFFTLHGGQGTGRTSWVFARCPGMGVMSSIVTGPQRGGEVLVQFIQRRDLPPNVQVGSRVAVDSLRIYYSRFASSMGDSLNQLAQAVEDVRVDDAGSTER